jgi:hypothetical protein
MSIFTDVIDSTGYSDFNESQKVSSGISVNLVSRASSALKVTSSSRALKGRDALVALKLKGSRIQFHFSPIFFFFLWLYSPILGLGCLHETFRFISVTRSRRVDRTPWTGDQLIARPLLTAPGECDDDGEVGGMVLAGETEVLGENLPRHHFVHHESHLPPWWEASG